MGGTAGKAQGEWYRMTVTTNNMSMVICDSFAVVGACVASIANDGHVSVCEHDFRYPIKR